jgi:short subunit dehydrogenase-like uncharacterized protein
MPAAAPAAPVLDLKKRDGKELPLSGWKAAKPFVLSVLLKLPIYLLVLLPVAIVSKILSLPFPSKAKAALFPFETLPDLSGVKRKPFSTRTYDIVLFGATGFTGRLAARYVAQRYGTSIKWAIAGRRRDALAALRDELAAINPDLKSLPMIVADTSDFASLPALVEDTRVVLTTVGPFAKYGTPLVHFAAHYGTSYCDITGETDWMRAMIDKYDDTAKATGAHIVNMCGHDSVPWDLSALLLAQKLREKGEDLAEIRFYDEVRGSASGGTLATVFNSLSHRAQYKADIGFDPLLRRLDGTKSSTRVVTANQGLLAYSREHGAWIGPFVMASVNVNYVRRSNALLDFSPKLVYREAAVYSNFFAGFSAFLDLVIFGTCLFTPVLSWALQSSGVLPKPGEGPSERSMDAGFLNVVGVGIGSKGARVRSVFYLPTDPGYRDTARLLVEAGLTLALKPESIKVRGGVLSAAACMGLELLNRLVATGTTVSVEAL